MITNMSDIEIFVLSIGIAVILIIAVNYPRYKRWKKYKMYDVYGEGYAERLSKGWWE